MLIVSYIGLWCNGNIIDFGFVIFGLSLDSLINLYYK